jgi:pimeloyl-ACP methyl ester carboxylesterase
MPRRALVPIALVLVALFAFARAAPAAVAPSGAPPPLQWAPCDDIPAVECAFIEVPVDHAHPAGPQIPLRLGRVPATDPAQRKGVLLLIPGEPGPHIANTIGGDSRRVQHIDEFRCRWDVVSFDPRGIEQSSPIRCAPDLLPRPMATGDRPPTAAEFEAIARANAAFIESCAAATGELMTHLSAMNTAADIERIRQALSPNDGLVAYGGSYGTQYAQAYLERYGEHVKALVLDAVMDHSIDLPPFSTRNILAVQDGFERFGRWCARDSACALHGQDVGAVFDAVVTAPR